MTPERQQEIDDIAFRMFVKMNPHEAYESDPERFMELIKFDMPDVTAEDIRTVIKETR